MSATPQPKAVASALRAALTGGAPPPELLTNIGGWDSLEALAPTVVDDPILTPAIGLLVRELDRATDSGHDTAPATAAAVALADAVLSSRDPSQVMQGLELLCNSPVIADLVGKHVGAACVRAAQPPRKAGADAPPDGASVLRSAAALETAARLAATGHLSRHKVLAALADIEAPQPLRYARAVARTVSLAFDLWAPEDEVAHVIDILTGVRSSDSIVASSPAAQSLDAQYSQDIEADALWTIANIEVAKALRAPVPATTIEHFSAAMMALDTLCALDDRQDAELLRLTLQLVSPLLAGIHLDQQQADAGGWNLPEAKVIALARYVDALTLGAHGLGHWSNDRKLVVLRGWQQFVDDLAFLQDSLSRDSLYEAAVVLDDVLAIYSAQRSYDLTRTEHGVEHLLRELRPAVEGGFAARAGLWRNLSDHTEALQRRIDTAPPGDDIERADLQTRLDTARTVMAIARERMMSSSGPPGKAEQAAPLPPLLRDLFADHPAASGALSGLDPDQLRALAANVSDLQATTHPGLIETRVRADILGKLSASEDFTGDVVPAVTRVLDQLIAFVSRRMNTQKSSKAYLFDPSASESDLHEDLYDWLSQGQLSAQSDVEVQEVGAGRVDIQITFAGFHLYLELKADPTATPLDQKQAFIKQTVAYQATSVRIGFLVVLRLAPPKKKSPSPHLSDYVTHTSTPIHGSATERHVVMFEIPGNQTRPSGMS